MKLVVIFILGATVLLLVACNSKKRKTAPPEEENPVAVMVSGEEEPKTDSLPEMRLEVRGVIFPTKPGEIVSGHYDNVEKYWVCNEDETVWETSPNTYGDKKYTILKVRDKEGTGLIDENGKIVVLPMYASIETGFCNGFCKVQTYVGKYGLIAENGKELLPAAYDDIWNDDIKDGLIKLSKDELQGFVNLQGKTVIPFKYQELEQAGDGMIWFMQKPQHWGCINYKNEIVVQPEFTHTAPFVNGKAAAQKADAQNYFIYTNEKVENSL